MATTRRVSEKMGISEGARVLAVDAPAEALRTIELPPVDLSLDVVGGPFDHVLLFVKTQTALDATFPTLKSHLAENGKLWVVWPKGRKLGTDLDLKAVIRIGYSHGMVESVNLRIDDTWTALKFTHPKPGKTYHNSYGRLPS